jgi:putative transposase
VVIEVPRDRQGTFEPQLVKWDALCPTISKSWRARLPTSDPALCRAFGHSASVIYTTNATPSVNMMLRKVTRNHGIFPSDGAVYKGVYLAMRTMAKKWTMPIRDWKPALNRFAVEFAERFPR